MKNESLFITHFFLEPKFAVFLVILGCQKLDFGRDRSELSRARCARSEIRARDEIRVSVVIVRNWVVFIAREARFERAMKFGCRSCSFGARSCSLRAKRDSSAR